MPIDEILAVEEEDAVDELFWTLADHQGSVRDAVRYDDSLEETKHVLHREFDSFGNIDSGATAYPDAANGFTSSTVIISQAFTGRFYDENTGLYDYRARWYDPATGSYLSEDPLSFDGGDVNLYRYCHNSPTIYIDPSGQSWFSSAFNWVKKQVVDPVVNAVEHVVEQVTNTVEHYVEQVENTVEHYVEQIENTVEHWADETGDFFEEQWADGTFQKIGLGVQFLVGAFTANPFMMASSGTAFYEAVSGKTLGDGTLSRALGATSIVVGGFSSMGVEWQDLVSSPISSLSNASDYLFNSSDTLFTTTAKLSRAATAGVSAYEAATGSSIGDGTLTNVFYATSLATNNLPTALNSNNKLGLRLDAGFQVGAGAVTIGGGGGDLARSVNIAGSLYNTGQAIQQVVPHAVQAVKDASEKARQTFRGQSPETATQVIQQVAYNEPVVVGHTPYGQPVYDWGYGYYAIQADDGGMGTRVVRDSSVEGGFEYADGRPRLSTPREHYVNVEEQVNQGGGLRRLAREVNYFFQRNIFGTTERFRDLEPSSLQTARNVQDLGLQVAELGLGAKAMGKSPKTVKGSSTPKPRINKVQPVEGAGPHTGFKRDPITGKITGHTTFDKDGFITQRTDVTGSTHGGIKTPHTHIHGSPNVAPDGRVFPGREVGVRPALPNEIP